MSELEVQNVVEPNAQAPGLSQLERVTNTFSAPSKTFEDIKRGNKSWWMPLILVTIFSYILFAAITMKVGWSQVADNTMRMDPKSEERMANMPADQRATAMKFTTYAMEGSFAASPVLILIVVAVGSLILWGTINFVFGGKATYGAIFAVWFYASLPSIIKSLLGAIVIFINSTPETFNLSNFAPTNIGAFLTQSETNKALYSLATSIDIITIWSLILTGIGISIVAGVKRTSGYIAVFGWWAIIVLVGVAYAAITG
jgi:hypothetical protein